MPLVGEDAKQEVKPDIAQPFLAADAVLPSLYLAQALAGLGEGRKVLNQGLGGFDTTRVKEDALTSFSRVPLGDGAFGLYVGSEETHRFMQVPLVQVRQGIDFVVSGEINNEGKATKFDESRKLSDHIKADDGLATVDITEWTFAVALIPRTPALGDNLYVSFSRDQVRNFGEGFEFMDSLSARSVVYHLGVNGFLVRGLVARSNSFVPFMMPSEDRSTRYMKVGEQIAKQEEEALNAQGIFPGLIAVSANWQGAYRPVLPDFGFGPGRLFSFASESLTRGGGPLTMGVPTRGAVAPEKDIGLLGVEEGGKSAVRYGGPAQGTITGIRGVMGVYLLPCEEGTTVEALDRKVREYVRD
jgi:hypothetical protein